MWHFASPMHLKAKPSIKSATWRLYVTFIRLCEECCQRCGQRRITNFTMTMLPLPFLPSIPTQSKLFGPKQYNACATTFLLFCLGTMRLLDVPLVKNYSNRDQIRLMTGDYGKIVCRALEHCRRGVSVMFVKVAEVLEDVCALARKVF